MSAMNEMGGGKGAGTLGVPVITGKVGQLKAQLMRTLLLLTVLSMGLAGAGVARADLSLVPTTWDVIGLDSNRPASGPYLFPVGARVCSSTGTVGQPVSATFRWTDGTNANIALSPWSLSAPTSQTQTLPPIAAGQCGEAYFEVEILRDVTSYKKTRKYVIEATYSGLGSTVSTPTDRQLYVEYLISQNRNTVSNVSLVDSSGLNPVALNGQDLQLGGTYYLRVQGATATQGYNQFESYLNLPDSVFQIQEVRSTYAADNSPYVPGGPTSDPNNTPFNPSIYANACLWDPVVGSPSYKSCVGGDYKAGGGPTYTTYKVKVIGGLGTSVTLASLLYDFSGSSYHYNSDFGARIATVNIIGPQFNKFFSSAVAGGTTRLTFKIANNTASDITGVNFVDNLPLGLNTPSQLVVANPPNVSLTNCGSPTFSPAAGATSLSFSGGTISATAPNNTCTISVDVTSAGGAGLVVDHYDNVSENLFVNTTNDTGLKAAASVDVDTPQPGNGNCGANMTVANLAAGGAVVINSATLPYRVDNWPTAATPNLAQYFQFTSSGYAVGSLNFTANKTSQGATNAVLYYSFDGFATPGIQVTTLTQGGSPVAVWTFANSSANYGATGLPGAPSSGTVTYRIVAYAAGQSTTGHGLVFDAFAMSGCYMPTIAKGFSPGIVPVATGVSTLTFTLSNTNPTALTSVAFHDILPDGMEVATAPSLSNTCGGTWAPASGDTAIDLIGGSLPAGGTIANPTTCSVSVNVVTSTEGLNYNLSDFISSAETGTNTGAGGSATAELKAILPPVVNKAFGPNPILSGGQSELLITITNPNQDYDILNLSFTDTFPANLTNVTTTSGSACNGTYTRANGSPATLTLTGGSLLRGESCQISVVYVTSTDTASGGLLNSVAVNSTDAGQSNLASDTLFVRTPAGSLALLKQVSTSATGPWSDYVEVETGSNVYYRFVVENTGDLPLTNVVINDATLGLSNYACVASLAVQAVDTCAAPSPVAAVVGDHSNTATASASDGSGTPTSDPSTADYKGMDLEAISGYIWKDNGSGGGTKEDALKDGGEAQVNLASLDNTFVVIRNSTGTVLDVVQVCTSTGLWPTIGCTPGSWTTSVAAGLTGLTAYVTYPAAGNPLPLPGQTVTTPFIGVSDSNFNLTGGNRTGGTPVVSSLPIITFDATAFMQVNFGIYRNNCPIS